MYVKALLLLLTGSVVSGGHLPKALWQFAEMISCVQPGVNPLNYNEYGCYCGFGGGGTPVDDVDSCSNKQVDCSATNNKCQAAVCECDRVAAHCFARYTYNPDNKYIDPKLCAN
ncbi:hypothetical protein GOODEAATRI_024574 [Goodea atripinnis]|uniref:Phospholipase A2 n=1 Tax=Goodea atripinnis TaxID=208336 RepID=A0ABV0Q0P7_9TELE